MLCNESSERTSSNVSGGVGRVGASLPGRRTSAGSLRRAHVLLKDADLGGGTSGWQAPLSTRILLKPVRRCAGCSVEHTHCSKKTLPSGRGCVRLSCSIRSGMDLVLQPTVGAGLGRYESMSLEELLGGGGATAGATQGGASPTLEQLLAASPKRLTALKMSPLHRALSPRRSPHSPRDTDMKAALSTASPSMKAKLMKKVWDRTDAASTGALGRDQVKAVLVQMGRAEADLDMDQAMAELDTEGDGTVDFGEFESWFAQQEVAAQERMYVVYYKAPDGQQAETTLAQLPALLGSGTITDQTIIWMDRLDGLDDTECRTGGLSCCGVAAGGAG